MTSAWLWDKVLYMRARILFETNVVPPNDPAYVNVLREVLVNMEIDHAVLLGEELNPQPATLRSRALEWYRSPGGQA